MNRRVLLATVAWIGVLALASGYRLAAGPPQPPSRAGLNQPSAPAGSATPAQRALLNQYCVGCHNERTKAAGLALDGLDVAHVGAGAESWEKVVRKVRGGLMPPPGRPRPDNGTLQNFAAWLETELDRAAASEPNPGRTEAFHRLNRAEYRNAVRDLLAVDVDVRALLPADDGSYGFDNMAGVLRLDQSRLEQYLSAALKVSRAALGTTPQTPSQTIYIVPNELPQYDHVEGLPIGTRGGGLFLHAFPYDAEYEIKGVLKCQSDTDIKCDAAGGFLESHQFELTVDGERVKTFTLEARPKRVGYQQEWDDLLTVRVPVKAGPHALGATFFKSLSSFEYIGHGYRTRLQKPYRYEFGPRVAKVYEPFLEMVMITGPFDTTGPGETPSRRRILICQPASAAEETPCARSILSKLARGAYRRPPTAAEVQGLLKYYTARRAEGGGFDEGIETAIQKLLVSPEFLLRIEREPSHLATQTVSAPAAPRSYRISDFELASRLSFFLWSSVPDDELIDVASRGQLHTPAVLARQVRRMLADDRAQALLSNFAGQWLELRNLEAKRPADAIFPNFDESLRQSMKQETELFLDSIRREDRNVLDLLTADYTFLNERLALHYGIPQVKGSHFRRVTYAAGNPRRGLLGHGSVLTVTSQPARTSPVIRGKWLLTNILGTPPPDPPDDVPPLSEREDGSRKVVLSVRDRMAQHRANPACASCHSMIDPLGFALEHFDGTGQYREVDEAFTPIDASAVLPDGTKVNGAAELREVLVRQPGRFLTTMTSKLLTYALGRGVEYYDMPAVRHIVRDAARHNYRFSSIVLGVVNSLPFQMRNTASSPARVVAASR